MVECLRQDFLLSMKIRSDLDVSMLSTLSISFFICQAHPILNFLTVFLFFLAGFLQVRICVRRKIQKQTNCKLTVHVQALNQDVYDFT